VRLSIDMQDRVSGFFASIQNNEAVRNRECILKASGLIAEILRVLQRNGYIGAFEYVEDGRGGKFRVQLLGRINRSAPIRPRVSVKKDGFERWEKQYLPGRGVGILIVTTPMGVMTHAEAREKGTGGKLLGYVY